MSTLFKISVKPKKTRGASIKPSKIFTNEKKEKKRLLCRKSDSILLELGKNKND